MTDTTINPGEQTEALLPPAISLREAAPWIVFAIALWMLYFVGLDGGALSIVPGENLHEWVHDGRHLLGFPCH